MGIDINSTTIVGLPYDEFIEHFGFEPKVFVSAYVY